MTPYEIVREFENDVANYANSKYAVAVDNGTNALFLCCRYLHVQKVTIPSRTYISVPCAIIHAGGTVNFRDLEWKGSYQLEPYPIYDSACQLSRNMYVPGTFQCLSFSSNKPINIGKGGMILTDDPDAVAWFKLARYEGRQEIPYMEQESFDVIGWNMYMTPEQAARGHVLLGFLGDENILENQYPDLSKKFKASSTLR